MKDREPDYPASISAAAEVLEITRQEAATIIWLDAIPTFRDRSNAAAKLMGRPAYLRLKRGADILKAAKRRELVPA